jgi:hypothetical protein
MYGSCEPNPGYDEFDPRDEYEPETEEDCQALNKALNAPQGACLKSKFTQAESDAVEMDRR